MIKPTLWRNRHVLMAKLSLNHELKILHTIHVLSRSPTTLRAAGEVPYLGTSSKGPPDCTDWPITAFKYFGSHFYRGRIEKISFT